MKIIKAGIKPEDVPFNRTCKRCNTEFEYTRADIKPDQRDGDYVICPVCQSFINHSTVINSHYSHWQDR